MRPRVEGDMAPRDPRSRRLVDVVRMGVDDPSSCKGCAGWDRHHVHGAAKAVAPLGLRVCKRALVLSL